MVHSNTATATANTIRATATDTVIHVCTRQLIRFQQSHVPDRQPKQSFHQMDRRCMEGNSMAYSYEVKMAYMRI